MRPESRERGQVMVLMALLIPVFFGLGAVVMDVGNWFVHKRHLQTQVDAAVFASGTKFVGCFLNPSGTNNEIRDEALRYAGDTLRDNTTANQQVQEPNDVRVVLNSASYWSPADGTDISTGYALDWTMDGDPSTPTNDSSLPCDAKFLDAKATDDDAPLLWGLIPLSPSPKAKAKVEIRKLQGLSGFLPWAVPESNPRSVAALFVDETATNTVASWAFLNGPPSPNDTETLNGETAALWSGPASVDIVNRTGMIVLTSRQLLSDADLTGKSLSQMCTMTTAVCYGNVKSGSARVTTNGTGVQFIRGTPLTDPSNNQVTLTTVELTTTTPPAGIPNPPGVTSCATTDPDSSPYFLWNADCQVRIRAQIEFGSLPNPREVQVCAGGIDLELRDGWWESRWLPRIDPDSGRNGYTLCWKAGTGGSAPSGNFGGQQIQMAFAANDEDLNGPVYSGPMVYSAIRTPSTGCVGYGNALDKTTQTICVEVGLQPPLRLTDGNEPPVFLRIAGTSLNQMLDCDEPNRGPEDEIRDGCLTPYQVNTRDLECSPNPTWEPNNLPPPPDVDPWPDCIEANPGQVQSMSRGIKQRFEDPPPGGAGCPPNLWRQYRSSGEVPPPEDPRFITLVVAEYGTFDDQGIKVLPITKFAGFYVTGWFTANGSGFAQGCPSLPPSEANDPPPPCPDPQNPSGPQCDPGNNAFQGAVWGYFITEVKPSPAGTPSDELCAFDELGTCIAVLTE